MAAAIKVAPAGRVDRLERAVDRVHGLLAGLLEANGKLEAPVETELLAIMGELSIGLVDEAAFRAERLAHALDGGAP